VCVCVCVCVLVRVYVHGKWSVKAHLINTTRADIS